MIKVEQNLLKMNFQFYQNLGKLFYAVAASDKSIKAVEIDKLKEIVRKEWLATNLIENDLKKKVEDSIINTFLWLEEDHEYDAETCYKGFVNFKRENEQLFTVDIKALIIKTAETIAFAFSGINKQELIMLTRLKLELNKNFVMDYYFTTTKKGNFDTIESNVLELLKTEGFGIITQIDMQQTLKNKLDVDFKKYKILGACNPSFAYKALQVENKIGTMLPCNIILQEIAPNTVEVSAINPLVSMQAIKNNQLNDIAQSVGSKLKTVINNINHEK